MQDTDLASIGALLGDPSRARMLDALMSGRALAAGELAHVAGVVRSTASEHLARLREGGLVEVVAQGRHRYYRLAGPDVGAALEAISHIAPARPVRSLRQAGHARALAHARTCYDHLAGLCGVELHDALLRHGWLTTAYEVTPEGVNGLAGWGIAVEEVRSQRRSFLRPCLDWTERRPHLAGGLAAALADNLVGRGWFARRSADSRALRLTELGRAGLLETGCQLQLDSGTPSTGRATA